MGLCRWTRTSPSLLLHPTDFLGSNDRITASFLPAMGASREQKLDLLDRVVRKFKADFEVLTMRGYAERVEREGGLPVLKPNFSNG